ncbi:hypothetical protein [Desulfobulbus elongatus]|uniref:hypothetical protein n=1 Tax=Desulfobulbus elongatus TaxID=53332 RepID=UPI0012F79721|nr:hypothetical protein [Desulfobulbus elongatus]
MMPSLSSSCKSLVLLSCLCGLILSGCAGSDMVDPYDARSQREAAAGREKTGQPQTEVVRRDVLMPVMSSINGRIRAYEQKVEEWREVERKTATMNLPQEKLNRIDECRSHLQHILIEYNALQRQLQQETRIEAAQLLAGNSLLQLNQQDIDYLESGCGKFQAELKSAAQTVVAAPPDPQIKEAFDGGDYGQVINLYGQVAASGQVPAPATTFQYGQALLKNHQEAEANRVLGELLGQIRQQQGQDELLLRLLQSVADLNFGLEAHDEARKHYEDLIRLSIEKGAQRDEWAGLQLAALLPTSAIPPAEMKEYSSLLNNYLAYVPKRDGFNVVERADTFLRTYPTSHLAANVNLIKRMTREQNDRWVNQGGGRIEAQAGGLAAAQPVVPGTTALPPGDSTGTATGQSAGGGFVTAVADERTLQEEYDRGVAHLQAREYDKAIERFSRLQRTSYEAKARPQLEEASRLAAQEMRQKAAELFVRASNSRDPEDKRKLLLASRDLLQGILVKYPQSGLTDRVQKNLARIEAELRAVDATNTAPRPAASGGAYVPPKSGSGTPGVPATTL